MKNYSIRSLTSADRMSAQPRDTRQWGCATTLGGPETFIWSSTTPGKMFAAIRRESPLLADRHWRALPSSRVGQRRRFIRTGAGRGFLVVVPSSKLLLASKWNAQDLGGTKPFLTLGRGQDVSSVYRETVHKIAPSKSCEATEQALFNV